LSARPGRLSMAKVLAWQRRARELAAEREKARVARAAEEVSACAFAPDLGKSALSLAAVRRPPALVPNLGRRFAHLDLGQGQGQGAASDPSEEDASQLNAAGAGEQDADPLDPGQEAGAGSGSVGGAREAAPKAHAETEPVEPVQTKTAASESARARGSGSGSGGGVERYRGDDGPASERLHADDARRRAKLKQKAAERALQAEAQFRALTFRPQLNNYCRPLPLSHATVTRSENENPADPTPDASLAARGGPRVGVGSALALVQAGGVGGGVSGGRGGPVPRNRQAVRMKVNSEAGALGVHARRALARLACGCPGVCVCVCVCVHTRVCVCVCVCV
jgi:hypothetical protein